MRSPKFNMTFLFLHRNNEEALNTNKTSIKARPENETAFHFLNAESF